MTWSSCGPPGTTTISLDEFLGWAERVAATTTLANAAQVLAWNTHKTYLRELGTLGLPVVDTTWLDPGRRVHRAGCGRVRGQAGCLGGIEEHQPLCRR